MKKRFHPMAVLWVALVFSTLCWAQAASIPASRTNSRIFLNDTQIALSGYNIEGSNYFRIRDLAKALTGTSASFEVSWNAAANQVELLTGQPYTEIEDHPIYRTTNIKAVPSSAQLLVDGQSVDVTAYNVDGNNYYKLRDLSGLLGYEVVWLEEENSICLYTGLGSNIRLAESSGGSPRQMTSDISTSRWAQLNYSYLIDQGGVFSVLDLSGMNTEEGPALRLDTYEKGTFALKSSQVLPIETGQFGGFFAGASNYYMVFGSSNLSELDSQEVLRVVKYDKSFQRLDSLSVNGGDSFTILPFSAGSLRMDESGNELVIHTSRKRYTTDDGLNHQSQLTLVVDTDQMTVKNDLGRFQTNHVSHSFNQFVRYDGEQRVLVDHGDSYPRSVVLHRLNAASKSYEETDLFLIPGADGANCTGVTVGGFEISDRNYLVAINTIDHSKVTSYDSFQMTGLTQDERNIVLLVCSKSDFQATDQNPKHLILSSPIITVTENGVEYEIDVRTDPEGLARLEALTGKTYEYDPNPQPQETNVKQVTLTDYIDHDKLGSTPYLVKLSNNRFMVLWEEYLYVDGKAKCQGARYALVDGDGQLSGTVQSLPDARLAADCQPVYMDGAVLWYVNGKAGRLFYQIPV